MGNRNERGEGTFSAIVWLVVFAVVPQHPGVPQQPLD